MQNLLWRKSEMIDSLSAWGKCTGVWLGSSPFLQQPISEQEPIELYHELYNIQIYTANLLLHFRRGLIILIYLNCKSCCFFLRELTVYRRVWAAGFRPAGVWFAAPVRPAAGCWSEINFFTVSHCASGTRFDDRNSREDDKGNLPTPEAPLPWLDAVPSLSGMMRQLNN